MVHLPPIFHPLVWSHLFFSPLSARPRTWLPKVEGEKNPFVRRGEKGGGEFILLQTETCIYNCNTNMCINVYIYIQKIFNASTKLLILKNIYRNMYLYKEYTIQDVYIDNQMV